VEPESTTPPQEKQVTVEVPEERVAEFYAWFARFLEGPRYPRRRRHYGERRCGPRREAPREETAEV
jgi:hypothetical protein